MNEIVPPLRRIFWGGVICAIDLKFKSRDFTFDVVNDVLGMILITSGVFRLENVEVTPSYRKAMRFVSLICILSTVKTFADQWVYEKAPLQEIAWILYECAEIGAILFFCFSMRLLCRHLEGPARSWKTTALWFIVFYTIPLGFLQGARLIHLLSSLRRPLDVGPLGFLFLLSLLPLIHLFLSTSRMRKAAERSL
jgi:hypothetical protein